MCSGEGMERVYEREREFVEPVGRHREGRLVITLCSRRT
jgi:hypothetical protein